MSDCILGYFSFMWDVFIYLYSVWNSLDEVVMWTMAFFCFDNCYNHRSQNSFDYFYHGALWGMISSTFISISISFVSFTTFCCLTVLLSLTVTPRHIERVTRSPLIAVIKTGIDILTAFTIVKESGGCKNIQWLTDESQCNRALLSTEQLEAVSVLNMVLKKTNKQHSIQCCFIFSLVRMLN